MTEDDKIGRLLVNEGLLSEEELEKGLSQQEQSYGKPLGEILLSMNLVDEAGFLRVLAKQFHTQYLTTKKLSELTVSDAILKLIPQATAEKYIVFPVQYRKQDKALVVVSSNPLNVAAIDEVKFVSGMGNIKALVGLHSSIECAINRWYKGEQEAFGYALSVEEQPASGGYDMYGGGGTVDEIEDDDSPLDLSAVVAQADDKQELEPEIEALTEEEQIELEPASTEDAVYLGGLDTMPGDDNLSREPESGPYLDGGSSEVEEVMLQPSGSTSDMISTEREPAAGPVETQVKRVVDKKKYRMRMLVVEDHDSICKFIVKLFHYEGFRVKGFATKEEALEELSRNEYDSLVIKEKSPEDTKEFEDKLKESFPDVELYVIKDYASAIIGETRSYQQLVSGFLETLDVYSGLMEMEGLGFQGHTHNVAKYARLMASKLDLRQREVDTITLAASVHDLGKRGMKHFTILNVDPGADVDEIMEQLEIPLKMLSTANLPFHIQPVIHHQYERWDGKGMPDELKGEDIPMGSRILALANSFEDLTNKYSGREAVDPTVAIELLNRQSGKLFDPDLLDVLMGVIKDDIYLKRMEGDQDTIMLVDTEMELTTLMELRLINMGYGVIISRDGDDALAKARAEKPSLIITETDLPGKDGFELISELAKNDDTKGIPFVFLSRRDDTKSVTMGLDLGAEDYITKPVKVEVLCAKVNTMMSRLKAEKKTAAPTQAAGVSGSLSEMSLPDIVQILGAGRKTGLVTLLNNDKKAEIFLEEGRIVNAKVDDIKGEEAFYQILYWVDGTFTIDPSVTPDEQLINVSNDSLILEGFRKMDEASRNGVPESDITMDGSDFF